MKHHADHRGVGIVLLFLEAILILSNNLDLTSYRNNGYLQVTIRHDDSSCGGTLEACTEAHCCGYI